MVDLEGLFGEEAIFDIYILSIYHTYIYISDIYQIMHDGLKNISVDVRKQCQTYVL